MTVTRMEHSPMSKSLKLQTRRCPRAWFGAGTGHCGGCLPRDPDILDLRSIQPVRTGRAHGKCNGQVARNAHRRWKVPC